MKDRERLCAIVLAGSLLMLAMAIIISGNQAGGHGEVPLLDQTAENADLNQSLENSDLNQTAENADLNQTMENGNGTNASIIDAPAVSGDRLALLQKGVNFYEWFVKVPRRTSEQYRSTITEGDLRLIKSLGFRHVRLQIDLPDIYDFASPGSPNPAMLAFIDGTIKRLNAHGLAVIITIQVEDTQQTPGFLMTDYKLLWSALAKHFSATNPDMVFLEVTNEPVFESDPSQWAPVQDQLIQAIRAGAPRHTILATGPDWSSIDGLTSIKPTTVDSNVVYVFHFYESMTFTHQGTDWSQDTFKFLKEVPYPATGEGFQRAMSATTDATARAWIQAYYDEGWNGDVIDARIRQAADWSRQNGVPVIADEFGCIDNAPAADRLQWFRDVRSALERYGIGWTLWTYDDYMGLDRKTGDNGMITLNDDVAAALGLNLPT